MIKCDDCGEEYDGYVCKNCGLVSEEKEVVSLPFVTNYDDEIGLPFSRPLSVAMRFRQIRPSSSTSSELNRALKLQNKTREKDKDDYYTKAHVAIKTKCDQLRLPNSILYECFNLAKELIDINMTYFNTNRADYRYLALIRLSCRIHNIYLDERELVQYCAFYDNKPINMRNSPVKKNIDREMMIIKRELGLRFRRPERPRFISHACNVLGIDQVDETRLYNLYSKLYKRFDSRFKLEGYMLALVYLNCKKYKIGLGRLEIAFGVARDTIRRRKKEIEMMLNGKKNS